MTAARSHHYRAKARSGFSKRLLILCISYAAASSISAAQPSRSRLFELSMEELLDVQIISAPRFASSPDKIPAAVTIIGQDQIRLYGWQTFADILQSLPGFNIANDYTYSYAAVRGLAVSGDFRSRVQVLVNGIRINENIYDSVTIDSAFLLDLSLIKRIEIIRGPSASVYGGNSMVALINIVTFSGSELDGLQVASSLGSGQSRQIGSTWGQSWQDTDLLLAATVFDRAGRSNVYPELEAEGLPAEARGVDGDEGFQVAAVLNHQDLRFSLFSSDRHKIVPNGSYGTIFNDNAHIESDKLTIAELRLNHGLSSLSQWNSNFYYGDYRYEGTFPYDYEPLRVVNQDDVDGQWWGLESNLTTRLNDRNEVVAGIEYRNNFRQHQINSDLFYGCYDSESTAHCLNSTYSSSVWSLYVQDELELSDRTHATLGLRVDKASDLASQISPRLGLVHSTADAGTIKYLFAKAFRNPNPFERFYELPSYSSANPDLAAETMNSHEVTWERQLSASNHLTTSLYQYDVSSFIATDADGYYSNSNGFSVRGVEATWAGNWNGGLDYSLSISRQNENRDGILRPRIMPINLLKLNVEIPVPVEFLSSGIEFRAASRRPTLMSDTNVSGYAITNVNLLYQPVAQPWSISAGIQDVFDREYEDPIAADSFLTIPRDRIRQLGRSWNAKLHYRF